MCIDCQKQKKSTVVTVSAASTMLASEYLYP